MVKDSADQLGDERKRRKPAFFLCRTDGLPNCGHKRLQHFPNDGAGRPRNSLASDFSFLLPGFFVDNSLHFVLLSDGSSGKFRPELYRKELSFSLALFSKELATIFDNYRSLLKTPDITEQR